jgi:lipopolysaccharide transport system ATP-binding protein
MERVNRLGTQEATILAVYLYNEDGKITDALFSGESLTVEFEYGITRPLADFALTLGIYAENNVKCFETCIPSANAAFGCLPEQGRLRCRLPELPLMGGRYYVNLGLFPPDWNYVYDHHWQMHVLHIENPDGFHQDIGVVSVSLCGLSKNRSKAHDRNFFALRLTPRTTTQSDNGYCSLDLDFERVPDSI